MDLDRARRYLSLVESRDPNDPLEQEVRDLFARLKVEAVGKGDQEFAKDLWCCETVLKVQNEYLKAFGQMKNGTYYEGWCTLERVEIALNSLKRHFDIAPENDIYKISFIETHTERFQSLFPYKIFLSPGALYLERRCTICGAVVSLRNHCGHVPGEIYNGELCTREVTQADLLELSLVTNPVQKYSVAFMQDQNDEINGDGYDYSLVRYVMRGLREPFHGWNALRTKRRHPHAKYRNVGRNDPCPCESGKKYKLCCLREKGVLRPHLEVTFDLPPPQDLPQIEYNY